MLLGPWENVDHLEAVLTLEELEGVLKQAREKEERLMKFYAAFKGVDLDKETREDVEDPVEAAKRRANARLAGIDEVQEAKDEWAEFGIEYESD